MKDENLGTKKLDKMMGELKAVIKDAENLLKNTEGQEGEGFKSARARFESTLNNAKDELLHLEQDMVEKLRDAAHVTDEYVKGHPWNSVGMGACLGLLVGLLVGRK
jgi:ElaB/YqjD/DUF883 family membrane-anchored ribosome-binding protein